MIYCILGNSASGKDTLMNNLLKDEELSKYYPRLKFKKLPMVTTRPRRNGEDDNVYTFVSYEEFFENYYRTDRLIEHRCYDVATEDGGDTWYYGTYILENTTLEDLNEQSFLIACSASQYLACCKYFKDTLDIIYPIVLHCRDTIRLRRYINRLSDDASRSEIEEAVRRIVHDKDYFNTDINYPGCFSSECLGAELLENVQEHIKTVFLHYRSGDIKSTNEVLMDYIKKELDKNKLNNMRRI